MCVTTQPAPCGYAPLPEAWRELLTKVQTVFPEAIIGGGALRDHYLGAPVKDIDIFVRSRDNEAELVASLGMNFIRLDEEIAEYANHTPGLTGVWDGPALCGPGCDGFLCACVRVQIIACPGSDDPYMFMWDQLLRFDIGICQLAHNGRQLTSTVEFNFDSVDRRLRIVQLQTDSQRERSLDRIERIAGKYPDWKIGPHAPVIPND